MISAAATRMRRRASPSPLATQLRLCVLFVVLASCFSGLLTAHAATDSNCTSFINGELRLDSS